MIFVVVIFTIGNLSPPNRVLVLTLVFPSLSFFFLFQFEIYMYFHLLVEDFYLFRSLLLKILLHTNIHVFPEFGFVVQLALYFILFYFIAIKIVLSD